VSKDETAKSLEVLCQEIQDFPRNGSRSSVALATAAVAVAAYTHEAMVELMVANPNFSHTELAAHFGRPASWMAAVLASEAFQQCLDAKRHLVADPSLTATMEERFRALALRSVVVLQDKLNSSEVADFVVLKAAEIGVKALGMGQRAPETPALPAPTNSSESVAEKLLAAMDARDKLRTIEAKATEVVDVDVSEASDGE